MASKANKGLSEQPLPIMQHTQSPCLENVRIGLQMFHRCQVLLKT